MKKITLLLIFLYSLSGYCQFPEGFESSATNLPTSWNQYQNNIGLGKTWSISSLSDPNLPPYICEGVNSAFIDKDTSLKNGETSEDYLISPLVSIPNNGQLHFFSRQGKIGDQETIYKLMISTNANKSLLGAYTTVAEWNEVLMNPNFDICKEQIVDISAYKGKQVYLAFVRICTKNSTNGSGDSWWIDNISLVSKCMDPSAGITTNAFVTTATLNWTDTLGSLWDIELVPFGISPSGIPTYENVTKPYNLTNLQADFAYQYYIRSDCSDATSKWVGPFDFKTLPYGSTCDGALNISSLPFQTTGNTANFPGTFNTPQSTSASCGAFPSNTNYFAGNDVFYNYTPTKDKTISVKLTPTASNSSIFIYSTCPISGQCLAGAANQNSDIREIKNFPVTAGTTYVIVISSSASTPKIGYTLVIQEENCLPPAGNIPPPSDTTSTTAKLTWTNPTGATEWRLAIQPFGSSIPVIEGEKVTTNSFNAINLAPATQYQYYVRSICSNGEFSSWAGPYPFHTLICEDISANKCDYTFNMTDIGSNGWNNATMQVRQNGIIIQTIGADFTSGAGPISVTVPLCKNMPFELYWDKTGTKPKECVVSVVNSFGQTLYTKAAGIDSSGKVIYQEQSVSCDTARCDIAPDSLSATNISTTTATLNWNAPMTSSWDVYIVPQDSPQPISTTTPTYNDITTNPLNITTGLLADNSYTFYVRVNCSPSPSEWSAGYTFTTLASCPKPTGLQVPVSEITTTQAKLYWTNGVSTDTKWEILLVKAVGPEYGTPTTPLIIPSLKAGDILKQIDSPSVSPFLITDLEPSTIYYYYIRTVCSTTDKSTWAGPVKFNTVTCDTANQCDYTFILTDSGNNGWDGGRMQVRQNGIIVSTFDSTFTTGGPKTIKIPICNNIPFDLFWSVAGTKPKEIGIKIINPANDPVYTKLPGDGLPLDVLFSSTGNCSPPSCPKPTSLNIQNLGSDTVTLGWTEAGSASNWEAYVVPTGTTQPDNNAPKSNDLPPYYISDKTSLKVDKLQPNSTYDFYVRALCSDSSISNWTLVSYLTFTTKPINDECDAAITISVNADLNESLIASGNTKGGTATLPATNPICQGFADDDIWFSFKATSAIHIISLKNANGTSTDLNHTLYSGSDCGAFTQLYCSNPDISLATNLTIGEIYKIRVYTNENGATKSSTFDISVTTPPQITNDECSSATELTVNPDLVSTASTSGTVSGASASLPVATCIGKSDDDVWYKFVAKSNTHYILIEDVTGTTTDLNHAVYSGKCDALQLVYCSSVNSLQGKSNTLIEGETYYVRVWSNASVPQNINFNISIGSLAPPITTSINQYTNQQLVEDILIGSTCVSAGVSNITSSTGKDFSTSTGIGYFNKSLSAFPFKEGIILSTGSVTAAPGPNNSIQFNGAIWWPGDNQLEAEMQNIAGTLVTSYNATKLEFDFTPLTDKISFNYIFASEEYGDQQCGLSDAFVFLLTNKKTNVTQNLAVIPNTTIPVSVLTIRDRAYKAYCSSEHANYFGQFYGPNGLPVEGAPVNFNGLTVPMKAEGTVVPGEEYHIKLVIADNQDFGRDSAVFIEGGSFNGGKVDLGADLVQSKKSALCPGDTYTISSGLNPSNYTISWTKDGDSIPNASGADLQISGPGTYSVNALFNNSTCATTDSIVIEYYSDKTPGTPLDLFGCSTDGISNFDLTQNSLAILSPYSDNHTVTYYPSLNDANEETNAILSPSSFKNTSNPQTIYARVDNSESKCHQVVSFKLTSQETSSLYTLSGKTAICPNEPTTIKVIPTNNSFDSVTATYRWTFNGNPIIGAYDSYLNLKGSDAYGSYTVTVTINNACTFTHSFEITNNTSDWDITFLNGPYTICPGQPIVLSFSANNFDINNPDAVYTWKSPDDSQSQGKALSSDKLGTYSLDIDILGCISTKNTTVNENTNLITINLQSGCSANDYEVEASPANNSFDPATAIFVWSFENEGDFVTTDKPNIIILKSSGTYKVKVTTPDGCSAEESITVNDISCTIQKGISPDGDGKNDNLDLTAMDIKRLEIFNRYGSEVFSKDNYTNEWHGQTNSGKDLPDGTYFYEIHTRDNKTKSGWIYINRKH